MATKIKPDLCVYRAGTILLPPMKRGKKITKLGIEKKYYKVLLTALLIR